MRRGSQRARARGSRLGQGLDPRGGFELEGKGYVAKDFYVYEEDFPSLGATASLTGSVVIQADSDFILQKLVASARDGATLFVPPDVQMTVVITDTGSGRQLVDGAVPLGNIFGSARFPFIMPTPRLFAARSTIEITLANISGAAAIAFEATRLSFIGFKAYPLGS